MSLTFSSSIVERIHSVPSYDLQDLIGDIGGSLGLFLGFCGLSFMALKGMKHEQTLHLGAKIFT